MIPESDSQIGTLSFPDSQYDELVIMRKVNIPTVNIKIDGRIGLWYIADIAYITYNTQAHQCFYYLSMLEHQTFGDMAGHLLAYFDWKSASWVELTETWDSIEETATDLGLI